jgi:hypothetical protein
MIKKLFCFSAVLMALVFTACPVDPEEGRPGQSGQDGKEGLDGWTPVSSLALAKQFLDAGVTRVYLSGSDSGTSPVTISQGTLWIPGDAVLGSAGGGLVLGGAAELIIDGTATLATGGLTVKSGGKLTVGQGGGIIAAPASKFIVEAGADVTVNGDFSGGAIGGASAAGSGFYAKKLGSLTKTGGTYSGYASVDALGEIKLGAGAAITDEKADIANAWATGVTTVRISDSVAATADLGAPSAAGAKVVLLAGANTLTGALALPANIAELEIAANAALSATDTTAMLTVGDGKTLTVLGTLATVANSTGAAITIEGTGKITAGGITLSGAGTVKTLTAGITLVPDSLTPAAGAVVTLTGNAEIQAGGADGITFKAGAYTFASGSPVLSATPGDKPTLTLDNAADQLVIGDTIASELVFGSNSIYKVGGGTGTTTPGTTAALNADVKLSFKQGAKIVSGTGAAAVTNGNALLATGAAAADNSTFTFGADKTATKSANASEWNAVLTCN